MSKGVPEWVCACVHSEAHRGGPVTPAFLTADCGEAPCVCNGRLRNIQDLRRDLGQPTALTYHVNNARWTPQGARGMASHCFP